jgi:glutamate racemase
MDDRPIGVFDSGLGGLTAVRRLRQVLPAEDLVFLGDTGRVPYGARSAGTILRYAGEDMDFLLRMGVKAVVVACGTVSSIALHTLTDRGVPVVGVVAPAARKAAGLTKNGRIGITGTAAAIRAGAYAAALKELVPRSETLAIACPMFVPLIEGGDTEKGSRLLETALEEYLTPIRDFGADTLILGCTHYPLIAQAISAFVGPSVQLVDVAAEAVDEMKKILAERGALAQRERPGSLRCHVTDSPGRFAALAGRFLTGPDTLHVRQTALSKQESKI